MCSVSRVSCQAERGNAGQQTGESETAVLRTSVIRPLQTDSIAGAARRREFSSQLYSIRAEPAGSVGVASKARGFSSSSECATRNHSARSAQGRSGSASARLISSFFLPAPEKAGIKPWFLCVLCGRHGCLLQDF